VAVAAVIRFWGIQQLGFSHWDEFYFISDAQTIAGVWPRGFTSMGWVTAPLTAYTDAAWFHFVGFQQWIPFAMSAIYGIGSTIAIYFLGSRLFGRVAGLIAAAIVATAEFSVMYSRMALADATFDFWLVVTVLALWLGYERRQIRYYVVAGLATGLLLNTKYTGVFPLLLATGWLGLELIVSSVRERSGVRGLWRDFRTRIAGTAVMAGIAIAMFLPFLLKIARNPGLHVVLSHNTSFGSNTLIKTSPETLLTYYWLFTSPATLLLAILGIAVGVNRFTAADRMLLVFTLGWFLALLLFPPYPREALSLLPAVAIWAARAIVVIPSLLKRVHLPSPWPVAVASAIALTMALQLLPLPGVLSLQTQGYERAGAIAASYQAEGGSIFTRTQAVASLYLHQEYFLDPSPTVENLLRQRSPIYLMTDQTLGWYPAIKDLVDANRDRLQMVDRVPNPLYDEVLLQPATADRLTHLNDPPDDYRYITFWRVMRGLQFPPSWPPT
jgi:4-amino-4-deoxy-L-arabinose transferase-like glycosyltransferase